MRGRERGRALRVRDAVDAQLRWLQAWKPVRLTEWSEGETGEGDTDRAVEGLELVLGEVRKVLDPLRRPCRPAGPGSRPKWRSWGGFPDKIPPFDAPPRRVYS